MLETSAWLNTLNGVPELADLERLGSMIEIELDPLSEDNCISVSKLILKLNNHFAVFI